jgi:heptosyltransferase-3
MDKIFRFGGILRYGDYPDLGNVKKILVVKLRHLGDVLLTGPVFSALKQALPGVSIDAYLYREAIPMLEGHPDIDGFIGYDRSWKNGGFFSRMLKEIALLRQIRKGGYDLVINLTEGDRGIFAAAASRAKIRVGFSPKGKWQKKVLTHIAKECPTLRHTVERNLDVLRRIGIFPSEEARELSFHIPDSAFKRADALPPFILIHPTSRWRFKCWPIPKMRELTMRLIADGKKIVFTSGPDSTERKMVEEITEGLDVINLSGRVSLKELGGLIERAELLISVDSVPFHIASALKKPVVALFGPTSEVTWGPWRNPHARIVALKMSCRPCYLDGCGGSKRSDCLESISVEAVLSAVRFLDNSTLRRG